MDAQNASRSVDGDRLRPADRAAPDARCGFIFAVSVDIDRFAHVELAAGHFDRVFALVLFVDGGHDAPALMAAVLGAFEIDGFADVDIAVFAGIIRLFRAARERIAVDRLNVDQPAVARLDAVRAVAFAGEYAADRSVRFRIDLCRFDDRNRVADFHAVADADAHLFDHASKGRGDNLRVARRHLAREHRFAKRTHRNHHGERKRCKCCCLFHGFASLCL